MVMHVLHKKLFRVLLESWAQSLAIAAVITCGVASFIAVNSAYYNLTLTRDTYYTKYRFADFEIILQRAPETAIFKLEQLPGLRRARARIVQDANIDIEGVDEPRVGRLISMPSQKKNVINDIHLTMGRYFDPGARDEVIVSERFATSNNLGLGDNLKVSIDNQKYTLNIVGLALSPEYVYMISGLQDLFPNPEKFGVLWVPQPFAETALDMSGACNNIVGFLDNLDDADSFLEAADALLDPYGVIAKVKKEDQISNRFLSDEIKNLGMTAKIFPTLFLSIAALIQLVLLTRMVRTERTQIGLMKAYGYSNFSVALHYLEYAMILSIIGCLFGFGIGQWLANGMIKIYVQFYQFPLLESRIYPQVLIQSMGVAVVFSVGGALFAAIRAAQIHPAESMRPEAPHFGTRVLLENWGWAWNRISFSSKMILRNLSRNRLRSMFNVFGVAISTGLMIVGFFFIDTLEYGLAFQFREVQREDVKISFQREYGKEPMHTLASFDNVRRVEPLLEYPFELRSGWHKRDIVVTGFGEESELKKLLSFEGLNTKVRSSGLVLTENLSESMKLKAGDMVRIKPLTGRITDTFEIPIVAVTEQLLGMGAYMEINALSRLLDEPFSMNGVLVRLNENTEEEFNRELQQISGIASVGFSNDVYQSLLDSIGQNMKVFNTIILVFSLVIAFSVIYNLTMVTLAERQRELASLRVLGLSIGEVGGLIYYENVLLSIIGVIVGIPTGMALSRWVVSLFSNDLFRLPYYIDQSTYGKTLLLIMLFSMLANMAVYRRITTLDLVEVLKERE